ncbi:hypothetical protein AB0F93_00450 [Micromonospora tulbaghiae]
MSTPWGPAQTQKQIARGIIQVSTAGHGGIHLSPTLNAQVHPVWREADGWYEEACDWAIVALTFPTHFEPEHVQYAEASAQRWHAKSLSVALGIRVEETVTVGTCPSCGKQYEWYGGWEKLNCCSAMGCDAVVPLHNQQRIYQPNGTTVIVPPANVTNNPQNPQKWEMFTVAPHKMAGGVQCGTWHGRVESEVLSNGIVTMRQMKPEGRGWKPGMTTGVHVAELRPLSIPVDEWGNPLVDGDEPAPPPEPAPEPAAFELDVEGTLAAINALIAAATPVEPPRWRLPQPGDMVIAWNDDGPVEYGGPDPHSATSSGYVMVMGVGKGGMKVLCQPWKVAPAGTALADPKDPRIAVEKRRRPMTYLPGDWMLAMPDGKVSWFKTKREAVAAARRRLAIIDYHAARPNLPDVPDNVMGKLRKVLTLGRDSGNDGERQAARARADAIATEHGLTGEDLAVLEFELACV